MVWGWEVGRWLLLLDGLWDPSPEGRSWGELLGTEERHRERCRNWGTCQPPPFAVGSRAAGQGRLRWCRGGSAAQKRGRRLLHHLHTSCAFNCERGEKKGLQSHQRLPGRGEQLPSFAAARWDAGAHRERCARGSAPREKRHERTSCFLKCILIRVPTQRWLQTCTPRGQESR